MKKNLLILISLVLPAIMGSDVSAFGVDDQWVFGWGQGISEAIITHGPGNQIYVTCGEAHGRPGHTGIRFMLAGDAPKGSNIILSFDNEDPEMIWITDGEITSNCRACMDTYFYVIEKLKRHTTVHVMAENGDAARFSLNGSAEAIGECEADFNVY